MKKRIFDSVAAFAFLAISPLLLLAQQFPQTDRELKTKLESFLAQTGTVVIEGYTLIGVVSATDTRNVPISRSIKINAMELKDATTGKKQSGIEIEIAIENADRSLIKYIDYDEIDNLVKGLDYISKATIDITKQSMFEATYKTKGDFSATTFSKKRAIIVIEAAVKSGSDKIYLSLEQLAKLGTLIMEAKQKLDSDGLRPLLEVLPPVDEESGMPRLMAAF